MSRGKEGAPSRPHARAPYPLPQPAPMGSRPGGLHLEGNRILLICARSGRAYFVGRSRSYRTPGNIHGWAPGELEGSILSQGFVRGALGWAHPDAESRALEADRKSVEQLALMLPAACSWCGRLYGPDVPALNGNRTHGMCRPCFNKQSATWELPR